MCENGRASRNIRGHVIELHDSSIFWIPSIVLSQYLKHLKRILRSNVEEFLSIPSIPSRSA